MKEEKYNETLLVIIILLLVIILKLIQEKDTNHTGVVSQNNVGIAHFWVTLLCYNTQNLFNINTIQFISVSSSFIISNGPISLN